MYDNEPWPTWEEVMAKDAEFKRQLAIDLAPYKHLPSIKIEHSNDYVPLPEPMGESENDTRLKVIATMALLGGLCSALGPVGLAIGIVQGAAIGAFAAFNGPIDNQELKHDPNNFNR